MRILKNRTIRYKLMSVIMFICVIALFLSGIAFIIWAQLAFRGAMARDIGIRSQITADNCQAALACKDSSRAEKVLNRLKADSAIVFAAVRDKDDNLFAAYVRDGEDFNASVEEIRRGPSGFYDGCLTVYSNVVDGNGVIGEVCVRSDMHYVYAMLKYNAVTMLFVVGFISLIAFVVSSRLQKIISGPILSLTSVAKVVYENEDYSIRAKSHGMDELGDLVEAFNNMLVKIQQRDSEFVNANKRLIGEVMERKRAEEKLKILNRALLCAKTKLEDSNGELQNFAYIASHDLREPLRKISSFGELLKESLKGSLDEYNADNLDFMIDGAYRMNKMIEGLLAYSRINTMDFSFETVDLNKIVEQLKDIKLAILLSETETVIEVPQRLPSVLGDPVQITQLVRNLISNGIKYRKEDLAPRIVIRAAQESADAGKCRIEIADNGIGIKQEFHRDIFTMFRRLHSRYKYEGTGIGLAVCKRIIERHRGEIGVESSGGEGSTFWFTLTVVPEAVREEKLLVAKNVEGEAER